MAQLALTYSYNFDNQEIEDSIAILAVIAQASIDSCKRSFDIDLTSEIKRIKKSLNIEENGLPYFWFMLKRKNRFQKGSPKKEGEEKENIMKNLNPSLVCPMNYVCETNFFPKRVEEETLPIEYFFQPFPLEKSRKSSKKLEAFIEKYCTDIVSKIEDQDDDSLPVDEREFEKMMEDLKRCYIPSKSIGVMSNLLDRAFKISPAMKKNQDNLDSDLWRNKPVLIKVLYSINKECLLKCFSANLK